MKFIKVLIVLLFTIALAVAAILFGVNEFGATHIIRYVELESQKKLGYPVKITDLHLDIFNFRAEADAIQFDSKEISFQAAKIYFLVKPEDILSNLNQPKGLVQLKIVEPKFVFSEPQKTSTTNESPTEQTANSSISKNPTNLIPFDFEYDIEIQNGDAEFLMANDRNIIFTKYNLKWKTPSLTEDQSLRFNSSLILEQGNHAFEFPIQLSTLFRLEWPRLRTSKSQLSFGPLALNFNGSIDVQTLSQRWALKAQVTNFKNLPYRPPQMLGEWLGRVMLDASIAKLPNEGIRASGKLHVVDLRGAVKIEHDDLAISGEPRLNLQSDFQYGLVNSINPAKFNLDLGKASVQYSNFLNKPKGIPFTIDSELTFLNKILNVPKLNITLSSMTNLITAKINTEKREIERLTLDIQKTNLKQMAQIIPAIDSRQTKGHLRSRIAIAGPIDDYMKLRGSIRPFELHDARTMVSWKNKDATREVRGLADASALINGEFRGTAIKTDVFDINADLSRLLIKHPKVIKSQRQKLLVRLNGSHKDKNFVLKNGTIQVPGGRVIVAGKAWGIEEPRFLISIATTKFNLGTLQNMLPALRPYPLQGSLTSHVKLNGQFYPDQPFKKLPIALTGDISLNMPSLQWPLTPAKTEKQAIKTVGSNGTKKADELKFHYPQLPTIGALKRSAFKLNLFINQLTLNKIKIRKFSNNTSFKKGAVSSTGKIGKIFGGKIDYFKADFSMYTPLPTTLSARSKGMLVEQILAIGPKQFADLAKGSLNADLDLKMPPLISKENIIPFLVSSGKLTLYNGTVKGLYLNRLIGKKTEGLKILKIQPPNLQDVIANYKGIYTFANRTAKFSVLNMTSIDERYQFRGTSSLNMDLYQNLTGEIRIDSNKLNIPRDFVEANSDDKERFIFPQMNCKGPIASIPSCKLLNPERILTKVAQYKLNKSAKKLENQGRKALEDAIKDVFK